MSTLPADSPDAPLPRLRQVVIAARHLDAVVDELCGALPLQEPFHDEGVGYFGLRNAVFALGDTFLEVVSPVREDTAAGRLLDRKGQDVCGYMTMFQVPELAPAQSRAAEEGVREVFSVSLKDIEEVHLHPRDMRGAIVSLSAPSPAGSWRWGGPGWEARSAPLALAGVLIAVADPEAVRQRWLTVIGALPGVGVVPDAAEPGLVEIALHGDDRSVIDFGGVRVVGQ